MRQICVPCCSTECNCSGYINPASGMITISAPSGEWGFMDSQKVGLNQNIILSGGAPYQSYYVGVMAANKPWYNNDIFPTTGRFVQNNFPSSGLDGRCHPFWFVEYKCDKTNGRLSFFNNATPTNNPNQRFASDKYVFAHTNEFRCGDRYAGNFSEEDLTSYLPEKVLVSGAYDWPSGQVAISGLVDFSITNESLSNLHPTGYTSVMYYYDSNFNNRQTFSWDNSKSGYYRDFLTVTDNDELWRLDASKHYVTGLNVSNYSGALLTFQLFPSANFPVSTTLSNYPKWNLKCTGFYGNYDDGSSINPGNINIDLFSNGITVNEDRVNLNAPFQEAVFSQSYPWFLNPSGSTNQYFSPDVSEHVYLPINWNAVNSNDNAWKVPKNGFFSSNRNISGLHYQLLDLPLPCYFPINDAGKLECTINGKLFNFREVNLSHNYGLTYVFDYLLGSYWNDGQHTIHYWVQAFLSFGGFCDHNVSLTMSWRTRNEGSCDGSIITSGTTFNPDDWSISNYQVVNTNHNSTFVSNNTLSISGVYYDCDPFFLSFITSSGQYIDYTSPTKINEGIPPLYPPISFCPSGYNPSTYTYGCNTQPYSNGFDCGTPSYPSNSYRTTVGGTAQAAVYFPYVTNYSVEVVFNG